MKTPVGRLKSLLGWVRTRPPKTLLFLLLIESFVFLLLIVVLLWVVFVRQ
jgi:hypothetical protein